MKRYCFDRMIEHLISLNKLKSKRNISYDAKRAGVPESYAISFYKWLSSLKLGEYRQRYLSKPPRFEFINPHLALDLLTRGKITW